MKVPLLDSLSPRRRRLVLWGVGLVLFYTIFGFFILPLIIRSVGAKQIGKQIGREVSIARVRINPYAMSGTISGFLIKDKDGQPFVSWDEVHANFRFLSLFTRTYVFQEIRTTQPFLRVQVNPDYSLNFSDILDRIAREAAAAPKSEAPSKPLSLRIDQLKISGARMSATDLTTRKPFTKIIGPLELTLQNFATDPENKNPYSFTGTTEEGERFSWSGHFFLDPVRSIGDFSLENVSLVKYAPLYQDLVRFDIREGTVDFRSSYLVEHHAHTNIARITNAAVSVRSLKVAETGAQDNAMEIGSVEVSGVSADAFGRSAEVGSVSTRDGRIALRRNADATINLLELSKPNLDATNTAGSVAILLQSLTNVVELLLRSTNAWVGAVQNISVENYAVRLEDLANARPVRLDLDQIRVDIKNVSNLPGTNITANVAMRWNTNGFVRTETSLSLFPVRADVKLGLENLEIRALDPYLDQFVNLLVTDGRVSMDGRAQLRAATNGLPDVTFRGDVKVDAFSTIDGLMTEDFVKWKRLQVSGIDAKLNPMEISIRDIALEDVQARLVVTDIKTNNVFAVLRLAAEAAPIASEPWTAEPAKKPEKKGSLGLPKIHLPTNAMTLGQGMPKIAIQTVTLTNARLHFVDRSIQPAVSLSMQGVSGTIAGLSSENLTRADVNLRGKVDNTAPMEITGKINPLAQTGDTDVKVRFQGIELIPTSPYAGKFIGYRLNKGKLSLDLHYQLTGNKVKGANLVTLDQLTLGEKVESPDATKLPVRLAIAILKDRSGKIELDVPVEGSLDDPEFRLGKVITRALLNVVSKIVTSPFAALGSIFGGKGEEVSFQDFAAGMAELQPANIEKLDALVKGLYERPGLQLEIEGSVDTVADRNALRQQKLQKELRMKKWMSLRKSERNRITPEQVTLTPEETRDLIQETHAAAFTPEAIAARAQSGGSTNSNPVPTTTPSTASSGRKVDSSAKGATALMQDTRKAETILPVQDLESQLSETIEITTADFAALAAERANRVKEYILKTGKVEPERLFLADKGSGPEQSAKGSRVYLHLR